MGKIRVVTNFLKEKLEDKTDKTGFFYLFIQRKWFESLIMYEEGVRQPQYLLNKRIIKLLLKDKGIISN